MAEDTQNKVDNEADFGEGPGAVVKQWVAVVRQAEKEEKDWRSRGDKSVKRFLDERDGINQSITRFNILWSNVETLKPALYARTPVPLVSRRYKDQDPLGLEVSEVMERAIAYTIESMDFDGVCSAGVMDYLLPGRGVARVDYVPTEGEEVTLDNGDSYRPIVWEDLAVRYVYWKDFCHGAARKWVDVPWVKFNAYLTRDELVTRFGDVGHKIPLDHTPASLKDQNDVPEEVYKKAIVWEIWDKTKGQVIWLCPSYEDAPLEVGPPPLQFRHFFPCPPPLLATCSNDSLTPVPDFYLYQDQANELDEITGRIEHLTEMLRVSGVYAADADEIQELLTDGAEGRLIPVANWAMFAERGGLDKTVSWFPVEQIANVLIGLYEARDRTKQDLYEITGIADVIRGATDASETATAQRIKGQFASLRIRDRQRLVQEWIKGIIGLMGEVIAEQFEAKTLSLMTGKPVTDDMLAIMRNDAMRSFRVDIETDSTIQPDEQADKEARIEFLNTMGGFLEKALPVAQQVPELSPLLGQMIMFGIRGFRAGRELEGAFDDALEAVSNKQPDPPPPDKVADVEKTRAETDKLRAETAETVADTRKTEAESAVVPIPMPGM